MTDKETIAIPIAPQNSPNLSEEQPQAVPTQSNLNTVIFLNPKNEEAIYNLAKLKLFSSDYQKSRELNKRLKMICKNFCLQSDKLKIEIENLSKK